MKTIVGVIYVVAAIFLFICAFHGIHVRFNTTVAGLALAVGGIGGSLLSKVWLRDPPDKTMERMAKALESIAEKMK
jgi:ABC-type uncharacterized transport system permease subunit